MKPHSIIAISAMALAVSLTSCSDPYGATNTYKENQIGATQEAVEGVVTNIEKVAIQANNANTGTAIGAVAGGLGGAMLGGGNAKYATSAGGVILGGLVGNQIDKAVSEKNGVRITVRLDGSKRSVSVVQEYDSRRPITVGQRVQVLMGSTGSRIVPLY
ncbi:hypothetical protein QET40_01625 [Akkermansia sp. N21169]|jgi:outer membrane lipoprotein SlyB|uniref:outer membrane lipoprotein n=1 Tax=Akkermansia sp. N21169 TaxID=3040765 RepID=UPI00244EBC49|nr:hypothetical protein [Akkermansia sp. N21169]MDH3067801.1 hypothetical protein [Akkermansia sp. N21169]